MKYDIIKHQNQTAFIKIIDMMLKEGWICQGGIAFGDNSYIQAMTKED
jgi:hypothetical protein